MLEIEDDLPTQYSLVIQQRLSKKGIKVEQDHIRHCRSLKAHDPRVVKELQRYAHEQARSRAIEVKTIVPSEHSIMRAVS